MQIITDWVLIQLDISASKLLVFVSPNMSEFMAKDDRTTFCRVGRFLGRESSVYGPEPIHGAWIHAYHKWSGVIWIT
jgi:hypothetical protein